MEEKYISAIDKIVRLCAQDPEFDNELRRRLNMEYNTNYITVDKNRFSNVEKYLGLDYYVDTQESNVDYSFVKNPAVRAQLISDNREMMRFRYGTRYHEIDFKEFCRYAHLQVEMLLNYYYDTINKSDLDSIKAHIMQYNKKAQGLGNVASLASISYNVKLWAFNMEHKIDYSLFENIRKVRNELSHRSIDDEQMEVETYQKYLTDLGFKLTNSGDLFINWKSPDDDLKLKGIYNTKLKNSDEYKRYEYIKWYISMPYDKIINGIKFLSSTIKSLI